MAITSVGYAGSITDDNWRRMATAAVGALYGVDDFASWKVSAGVGDRATKIAAGGGFGLGVYDYSDTDVTLTHAPVPSGQRWDLIVAHRDWNSEVTAFTIIPGSSTKAIPSRATGFGNTNDQPIGLARLVAGQTAVQEYVDLRCIPSDGGVIAFDTLVRSYLDRVGTQVRIGNFHWTRTVSSTGSPLWVYEDVTPDTGWVDFARNDGWAWGIYQHRRIGSNVFVRLSAGRSVGWETGNQLAFFESQFRPDVPWYAPSSASTGKTEWVFNTDGSVAAAQSSVGATGVTIHTTYPAARPE
jgi:hypothetical protein